MADQNTHAHRRRRTRDQRARPRGRAADGLHQGPVLRGAQGTVPSGPDAGPEDLAEPQHHVEHRRPGRARSRPLGDARGEGRRRRRLPRRGQAGGRIPGARLRRRRNAPHPRLVRAEHPVPVHPPDRVGRRDQGRLPAVPAAARQLRRAVRALAAGTGRAPVAASRRPNRRTERGADAADRRAGRRFLGNGARDPVRARRRPDGALGPRRGRARASSRASGRTSATCRARLSRPRSPSSRTSRRRSGAATTSCSSCPRARCARS